MDRCPLSFGTFLKPQLLPCLHAMCFTCLNEYARGSGIFLWSVCILERSAPEGGVSKFDDKQYIKVEQTLERALAAAHGNVPRIR
ncbi:hypothetical protein DPMN_049267 [Dreissena polymorpha]|uniref:Zinc finger C3HC4 RING-type domain-containing protein n=1 Tax=Dreissena polymorpha TaxID=45954 RepID=A0A9D4CF22_DREPO|nr:hypothetical protein DPMN_049267 [Dreissena polymorpha]